MAAVLTTLSSSKHKPSPSEPQVITARSWPRSIQRPTGYAINPSTNMARLKASDDWARFMPSSCSTGATSRAKR